MLVFGKAFLSVSCYNVLAMKSDSINSACVHLCGLCISELSVTDFLLEVHKLCECVHVWDAQAHVPLVGRILSIEPTTHFWFTHKFANIQLLDLSAQVCFLTVKHTVMI